MTFITFITNPVVQSALWALAYVLIYFFARWLSNKVDSKRLKALINLLPEAMTFAEQEGGSAAEKLNNAIDYIQDELKLPRKTIVDYIENGIIISKTINKENKNMKSTVSETPVTVIQRNLEMTLDEKEVTTLLNVIASSGRSADVNEIYEALKKFAEVHVK